MKPAACRTLYVGSCGMAALFGYLDPTGSRLPVVPIVYQIN